MLGGPEAGACSWPLVAPGSPTLTFRIMRAQGRAGRDMGERGIGSKPQSLIVQRADGTDLSRGL